MTKDKAAAIAALNDQCRQGIRGKIVRTAGIAALPMLDQVNIWHRVSAFSDSIPGIIRQHRAAYSLRKRPGSPASPQRDTSVSRP